MSSPPLKEYNAKRDFKDTPEPEGKVGRSQGNLRFVVQMHAATRLHYDLRLEMGGVFKSWAVPKGPSLNPQEQRLAVFVEDHPIDYGSFEGIIPRGNYGAGTVMVWDHGTYVERGSSGREDSERAMLKGLREGHLTFVLDGQKLKGEFALVRMRKGDEKTWLLIKKRDGHWSRADVTERSLSVKTGRSIQEIAADAPSHGDVWVSSRALRADPGEFVPRPKKMAKTRVATPESELASEPAREKLPRRVKPLLPTSEAEAFDQGGWLFEAHCDGYRAIAELEQGRTRLHSKQLLPFEKKFPDVMAELRKVPGPCVLDGEVVTEPGGGHVYWVFDLLHADGLNLRDLPLEERKKRLAALPIFGDRVRYRGHVGGEGLKAYAEAQALRAPALMAKEARSRYTPGKTSKHWLKIKVRPLEDAKPAREAATEAPLASAGKADRPLVALTNLEKVYWPKERRTKGDVIEYYRRMAKWILPHLKDRPQSLHRHPNGIDQQGFFQKDMIGHLPRFARTETIYSESAEKSVTYLVCQNEETLLYMINLGCIELNPWISRIQSQDHPDFMVIDLDPDGPNDFEQVMQAAREVRKVLNRAGAAGHLKTSGATGLHICVPTVGAKSDFGLTRAFGQRVCEIVHEKLPELTSVERNPAKRRGRIYLDFMQNRRGQTLAAPYCIRPRPGAPVSTPLEWSELRTGLAPDRFTVDTIFERLEEVGDLWRPMLTSSVDIEACLKALEG